MSSLILPHELWNLVLHYFQEDRKRTLMHCSLVCQAWTSISQRRLFTTFKFTRRSRYTPEMLAQFFSSTPKITAYVRDLTIKECPDGIRLQVLKSIFYHLPHLRSMRLRRLMIWGAIYGKPDPAPPRHLKVGRHLALLKWCSCDTCGRVLYSLLASFASIEHLVLSDPLGRLRSFRGVPSTVIPHDLSIEHLSLRYFRKSIVPSLFQQSHHIERLTSIELLTFGPVGEELGAMLPAFPSLQYVHLLWRMDTNPIQYLERLRLAQCTSLDTLQFTLLGGTFISQAARKWLPRCLFAVVPHLPPSLRVVRFGLVVPRRHAEWNHLDDLTGDPNGTSWAAVNRRLLNVPSQICIEFVSAVAPRRPFARGDVDAAKTYVRDRLPGVAEEGRLSVFEDI